MLWCQTVFHPNHHNVSGSHQAAQQSVILLRRPPGEPSSMQVDQCTSEGLLGTTAVYADRNAVKDVCRDSDVIIYVRGGVGSSDG